MKRVLSLVLALCVCGAGRRRAPRTPFRVKYVAEGAVYLDGGRNAGLSEGMKLTVRRDAGDLGGGRASGRSPSWR